MPALITAARNRVVSVRSAIVLKPPKLWPMRPRRAESAIPNPTTRSTPGSTIFGSCDTTLCATEARRLRLLFRSCYRLETSVEPRENPGQVVHLCSVAPAALPMLFAGVLGVHHPLSQPAQADEHLVG